MCVHANASPATGALRFFDYGEVALLESPFRHARDLDREYLRALDADRLLAGYLTEAGLAPKAEKYPNWESSGLDGHTLGHYLTALAQMGATGDSELQERLAYTVSELARCQEAHRDGYVGAVPGGREIWPDVAQGRIDADNFSLNGKWVPWYNLHKLYAGLRDAWEIGGIEEARSILISLSNWADDLVAELSDEQLQEMLRSEHGGMNEIFADVYVLTGEEKYLRLAERFSHRAILDPLLDRKDELTGLHANTQIPKVIGYARVAELAGNKSWQQAAEFFWDIVVKDRNVAFGGNSVREHFNPPDDFSSMLHSREGPETCNTYNMLRLTEQLYRQPGADRGRLVDYYERALYNHILSSQHPEHGGFVYFTPIRPQHYRVYSQPETSFWCCVGSGLENHGKYGHFIYAHADDSLYVNLFIPSELTWKSRGIRVRQETSFPDEEATLLTIGAEAPTPFTLHVRKPGWTAAETFSVQVNGEPVRITADAGDYVTVERTWKDGDTVAVRMEMETRLEPLPDDSGYVAVLHGPIVLAAEIDSGSTPGLLADEARMAHIAPGPYLPLDGAPMLVGDPATMTAAIRPEPGKKMVFDASPIIRNQSEANGKLVPFFRIHDSRYMMYWRTVTPGEYEEVVRMLAAEESARIALDNRTLDRVVPGEQQPEVEHGFRGENTATGSHLGRQWRDTGSWIEYRLHSASRRPGALRITYDGGERDRRFRIIVNGTTIADVSLRGDRPDQFIDVLYPLPQAVVRAAKEGAFDVRIEAEETGRSARIFDLRLIEEEETHGQTL